MDTPLAQIPPKMTLIRLYFGLLIAASLGIDSIALAQPANESGGQPPDFKTEVLPILNRRCGHCHGADLQEGRVRFDQLSTDILGNRAAAQTWREARNAINAAKMPPEDEPPLSTEERATVIRWITMSLTNAIEQQRSTAGRVVLRRLNRHEYQNTMFDLLGLDMNYIRDLPPDSKSADGYKNDGQSLRMSAIQLEFYLDTARRALEKVIVNDPPDRSFRHRFERSNVGGWRGPTEQSNRLERAQKFLVKMVKDYPEEGEFRVRVRTRADLKPNKGYPLLELSVGYRPDTEVHFRVAGVKEVLAEHLQQFEFRGRLENFPLPVRGQGKYPGLVLRLRNVYTDGSPIPSKIGKQKRNGKEVNGFTPEPNMPALLVESVEFEGPVYSEWPPKTHRDILFESDLRDTDEVAYVKEVLRRFMTRAYRRPPSRLEVEEMFSFFALLRPNYTRFEDAIRETLAMVLIQPDFLYLMEPAGERKRSIGDWELASRLSYFLWTTMPDKRLLDLAADGFLRDPKVLQAEVNRMLADKRSARFVETFVNQWLRLDELDNIAIDRDYYPTFRDSLKPILRRESSELFAELLRSNESALSLIDSEFTMLNEPLARHYGIEGVYGQRFRRVALGATSQRGGLLGHAAVLMANSNGQDSHPIRRAVWIRDRLLGDPPAPPPPDVPELDEADPDFAKLSVREQLEVHREKESCNSCHRGLDPWGIALEHFDAVGLWRDEIRKRHDGKFQTRPVAAADTLPNGIRLEGVDSLRTHLIKARKRDFAEKLVRSLLTYSLGRSLELTDDEEVNALVEQFVSDGYRLKPLVQRIVGSAAFLTK